MLIRCMLCVKNWPLMHGSRFCVGANKPYRKILTRNLSWWKKLDRLAANFFRGDDYVNPKKILERRYIYFVLLATREGAADDSFEASIAYLEGLEADSMSNGELRQLLQERIQPQVLETFSAFHRVDDKLGIPFSSQAESENLLDNVDREPFVSILDEESKRIETYAQEEVFFAVKREALDILLRFHETNSVDLVAPGEVDAFGTTKSDYKGTKGLRLLRQFQTINFCRSTLIREELGFSILSLRSSIARAGRGVYLDGTCEKGKLVAYQPGEVWPKEHLLTKDPDVIQHFEGDDDCHISLRFDEFVLDSRQSPVNVLSQQGSMNPWALGHMVNHPSKLGFPNCQSTMLDYTESMNLGDLIRYVPNYYARQPGWRSMYFFPEPTLMHGLCLISRRQIKNEELHYDYRLQSEDVPKWYTPVHYGDDVEDDQVVFFRDHWHQK